MQNSAFCLSMNTHEDTNNQHLPVSPEDRELMALLRTKLPRCEKIEKVFDAIKLQRQLLFVENSDAYGQPYLRCSKREMMILLLVGSVHIWMMYEVEMENVNNHELVLLAQLQCMYLDLQPPGNMDMLRRGLSDNQMMLTEAHINGLAGLLRCVALRYAEECSGVADEYPSILNPELHFNEFHTAAGSRFS